MPFLALTLVGNRFGEMNTLQGGCLFIRTGLMRGWTRVLYGAEETPKESITGLSDQQPSKPSPVTEVFISRSAYTDSFFPGLSIHTDNLVKSTSGSLLSSSSPVYSHYFPLPGKFFLVRYFVKEMREVTDTPTKRTLGHIPSPPFDWFSDVS